MAWCHYVPLVGVLSPRAAAFSISNAPALQVAHKMASEMAASVSRTDGIAQSSAASGHSSPASDTADLTAILSAHWHLGYRPSEKLLVAMGPFVCRRAAHLTLQQKGDLAHLLSDFEFDPGACPCLIVLTQCHRCSP